MKTLEEFYKELKDMSFNEIETLRHETMFDLPRMKQQIEIAKKQNNEHGKVVNEEWYRKVLIAYKYKSVQNQLIQEEYGKRKRLKKHEDHMSTERIFVNVAKKMLEKSVYLEIINEVENQKKISAENNAN